MAFSSNGGNGGNGRRRFRGTSALADINVVPLVDVMMVLLVIFMLTAHVMEFGLEVEVPKVRQVKESAKELPVITINKSGEIYLNDKPANINSIASEIKSRFPSDQRVYVRADKATIWDAIAQVVSELGEAKLQVSMVTQPTDEADKKRR